MNWKTVESIALGTTLVVLGFLFFVGRAQSVFLFPLVAQIFRFSQVISFVALDIGSTCRQGLGFRFESTFFPVFSGLYDYFLESAEPQSPAYRFVTQFVFTALYAAPLFATPLYLEVTRLITGRSPWENMGEISPVVALKRAAVTWLWLMLLPLMVIALHQTSCSNGGVVNYEDQPCPTASFSLALLLSLVVIAGLGLALSFISRKLVILLTAAGRGDTIINTSNPGVGGDALASDPSSSSFSDHLTYSFIVGAAQPSQAMAIFGLDIYICIVVALHRGFFRTGRAVPSTVVSVIAVVAGIIYLVRRHGNPYRQWQSAGAGLLALVSLCFAFGLRMLRDCSVLPGGAGLLNSVNVLVISTWLGAVGLATWAAVISRREKGIVIIQAEGYGLMSMDGAAPRQTATTSIAPALAGIPAPILTPASLGGDDSSRYDAVELLPIDEPRSPMGTKPISPRQKNERARNVMQRQGEEDDEDEDEDDFIADESTRLRKKK